MLYAIMRNRRLSNTQLYLDLWNKYHHAGVEITLYFPTPKQLRRMVSYLTSIIQTGSLVSDNEIFNQYNMIIRGASND